MLCGIHTLSHTDCSLPRHIKLEQNCILGLLSQCDGCPAPSSPSQARMETMLTDCPSTIIEGFREGAGRPQPLHGNVTQNSTGSPTEASWREMKEKDLHKGCHHLQGDQLWGLRPGILSGSHFPYLQSSRA